MAYAGKVRLVSNFATPADGLDRFEWLGVLSIAQGLQVLLEVRGLCEVTHGVKVLERVQDETKYFMDLVLTRTDRWKASAMISRKFVDEARMAMGHCASPQTAQRLSFVKVLVAGI